MKKALWYVSLLCLTPLTMVFILLEGLAQHALAGLEVIEILMFRWQCWAFGLERGSLQNCPWRYSLRVVYKYSLENR